MHMNVSGMAMTRHAPNPDNALALMEFLVSDEAQRMYSELNSEYPVKAGVEWSDLQKSWGEFKVDETSLRDIAAQRAAAIRLADEVGYDQ